MSGHRRRVIGGVLALVMVATIGAEAAGARAEAPPSLVYAYDTLGRLVAVTAPGAESAVYHYDEVGNLLEVRRQPAQLLSAFAVVPARAAAGAQVRLHGTGFSPRPEQNRVTVNGAAVAVVEATEYALTLALPDGVSSGPVVVAVGGNTTTGGPHLAVAGDLAPEVTAFSPVVVAPGDHLTITGQRFAGEAMVDAVVLADRIYAAVESSSPTELQVVIPPGAASGPVSVATPDGTGYAPADLLVVPWPDYPSVELAGQAAVELGTTVPLQLDSTGTAVVTSFVGSAGQLVAASVEGELSCAALEVGLAGPDGPLHNPTRRGGWCGGEATRLPADGTYTVLVAARDQRAGDVALTLTDAGLPGPTASPGATWPPSSGTLPPAPTSPSPPVSPAPADAVWPDGVARPQPAMAGQEPMLDGAAVAPVDLVTGRLAPEHTDMVVGDLMPLPLTRTYQPVSGRVRRDDIRAFGLGSGLEFALTLRFSSALQFADLNMPDGSTVPFERLTEGADPEGAVFAAATTGEMFDRSRIMLDGRYWRLQMDNGAALMFEQERRAPLAEVRDERGNALRILWERDNRDRPVAVASVQSPTGRWIAFDYDESGRVTTARDHLGNSVDYRYHDEGMLAAAVSSTAGEVGYVYDEQRRIVEITGAGGVTLLAVDYDDDGRVTRQRSPGGAEFAFSYQVIEETLEIEQPTGPAREVPTEVVVAAEVTDADDVVRRVTFDSGLWVSDSVEAGGEERVVHAERDPDTGFITATVDPEGSRTGYGYDRDGRLVRLTEAAGSDAERSYEMAYDPSSHQLTSLAGPDGVVQAFDYDEAGNLVRQVGAEGDAVRYAYDEHGRLTELTDQDGHITSIDYELAHRVTVTGQDGSSYQEFFDAAGQLVAITDAAGATTRFGYDGDGRPVTVTDHAGGQTTTSYDVSGNPVGLTDAGGNPTLYEVDEDGQVTVRTDAAGASDRFDYDDSGRLVQHVDRRGVRTTLRYDAFDRLVEVAYGVSDEAEAESTVRFRYDAADRLVELDDSTYGVVGFDYDEHGRLVRESTPSGQIAYAYDGADRRVAMTLPDGTQTRYGYDDAGRLASVEHEGAVVRAVRDGRGLLQRMELPNGVTAAYHMDGRGLVRTVDYRDGDGDLIGDLHYRYDAAGRRVSAGGSLAPAELPQPVGPLEYGPGNRLVRDGESTLVYDEAGNLLDDGVNTYTWDARGQLVAVDGAVSATFSYDPLGRRVAKTVDGITTTYTYDGANIVQQDGDEPAVTYLTGLGMDEVLARVDSDGVHSYLTDAQGSVVAIAGPDGGPTTWYRYDPYGVTTRTGEVDPGQFGFTGREADETGLYFYRHRYYQPELGRFISEDPLGFAAGDPNLYAYVFGDPVNHIDPDGQQAVGLGVCLAALGVALGVSLDAWQEMMDLIHPDRGPGLGTEEASIALDHINRRLQMTNEMWLTICSMSLGLSFPGFGGLAARGVGSFGRGLPTLGRTPGAIVRPPGVRPGLPRTGAAGSPARPLPRAGCSFAADTPVLLADGSQRPISQIGVGDRVLAADPVTGEQGGRAVTHTWAHDDTLVDLSAGTATVTTTADHPFWSETAGAWLPAEELAPGESLLTAGGDAVTVAGIDPETARVDVAYDLSVAELHSYYVLIGGTPVLVHNCWGGASRHFSAYPREFLDQAATYGRAGVRQLPDGRVRFYGQTTQARTPGEMAGRRLVREWNPDTGATRIWHETLDHAGNIRIVRPDISATGGVKIHYMFDAVGRYRGSF